MAGLLGLRSPAQNWRQNDSRSCQPFLSFASIVLESSGMGLRRQNLGLAERDVIQCRAMECNSWLTSKRPNMTVSGALR